MRKKGELRDEKHNRNHTKASDRSRTASTAERAKYRPLNRRGHERIA